MKNKIVLILVLVPLLLTVGSCEDVQDRRDRIAVNKQQEHYRVNQAVPFYEWSLELDAYKQIYDARVKDIVRTWTIWRSDHGMILGDCASIGFPIPYDVQMTNPLKKVREHSVAIEQPEPSGLYSSKNTVATWVRQVIEVQGTTVVVPIYIEDKVTAYPYPILVDYETNRVTPVPDVMPSVIIEDTRPDKFKKGK